MRVIWREYMHTPVHELPLLFLLLKDGKVLVKGLTNLLLYIFTFLLWSTKVISGKQINFNPTKVIYGKWIMSEIFSKLGNLF